MKILEKLSQVQNELKAPKTKRIVLAIINIEAVKTY